MSYLLPDVYVTCSEASIRRRLVRAVTQHAGGLITQDTKRGGALLCTQIRMDYFNK